MQYLAPVPFHLPRHERTVARQMRNLEKNSNDNAETYRTAVRLYLACPLFWHFSSFGCYEKQGNGKLVSDSENAVDKASVWLA